ncbi:hypothetical protein, partial [Streptomyces sp. DSM 41534]
STVLSASRGSPLRSHVPSTGADFVDDADGATEDAVGSVGAQQLEIRPQSTASAAMRDRPIAKRLATGAQQAR